MKIHIEGVSTDVITQLISYLAAANTSDVKMGKQKPFVNPSELLEFINLTHSQLLHLTCFFNHFLGPVQVAYDQTIHVLIENNQELIMAMADNFESLLNINKARLLACNIKSLNSVIKMLELSS